MTESSTKLEDSEVFQTHASERKKNMQLIENWYQSYYLWNTTYVANFLINSSIVSYAPRTLIPGKLNIELHLSFLYFSRKLNLT